MRSARSMVRKTWLLAVFGAIVLFFLALGGLVFLQPHNIENRIRRAVTEALEDRFKSAVKLKAVHIHLLPTPIVTAEELAVRYHGRSDVPPLIQVQKFSFHLGLLGLLAPVKHISLVSVKNALISIPPRRPDAPKTSPSSNSEGPIPKIIVDRMVFDGLDIRILPKDSGKEPLDWDIHKLTLTSAGANKPFAFHGTLTNGKPVGEIQTEGEFGPWNADDPGDSPVSGRYTFTNANLDPFPGIGGTLSSAGKYDGLLSQLEVQGQTDTPDFSLDKVGKPVPLHTEFSATVDGTNGDTYLHPVTATLVRSLIIAEGKVVRVPEKHGHVISIDATVPDGRIEDFLALAINSDKPLLTGPVKIKAKLTIPPGQEHVIDKMVLDGQFGVDDARWSSTALREKLQVLSRHAMGKPEDEDVGSAVSDLSGSFLLKDGLIHFRRLVFSVAGADIDLTGTYALRRGELDFDGHLRLKAKLSQTMTGAKSFFLKVFDPFFEKNGAGTELPIHISGTRDNPVFGVSVFHKTFDKHLTSQDDKASSKGSESHR